MTHDARHEERLLALLAEHDDPRAALAGSELADCEQCRGEVEQLLAASSLLDGAGAELNETLEAARSEVPGEHLVDQVLRPRLEGRDSVRPTRSWWPAAVAAAALVLVWVAIATRGGGGDDSGGGDTPYLGPNDGFTLTPAGPVDAWGTFTWDLPVPPRGTYELIVRDADGPATADALLEIDRLDEASWTPTPEQSRGWRRIRWQVNTYDPTGNLEHSASREAWLR